MILYDLAARAARRFRFLFGKRDAEREMNEEMRIHLEFEIEDRMKRGMNPAEARRTALVDFGGVERFKEEGRGARGVQGVEDLIQDASYALRVLRRSPTFALTTILTVALGIAATTTVFSAVNAILFRPPPVRNPAQLYTVAEVWKSGMRSWRTDMAQYMYFYKHYLDVRENTTSVFEGLAGYRYGSVALRSGDETRAINSMGVTPNFFLVLGVQPSLGKLFTDTAQYQNMRLAEVVIGYNLWQREFAGDSSVIGRALYVDSKMVTIVGVAPKAFHGIMIGLTVDLWLPATNSQVVMIGRLRPGISKEQALVALRVIAPRITPEATDQPLVKLTLDPIVGPPAMSRGVVFGFMGVLFATSALVLLIVTANIAGMFLARAAQRRREIAVRLAMGASRGRLVRQLLTESIALCVVGGVVGTLFATWLIRIVPAIDLPTGQTALLELRMDPVVLLVSFAATLIAGITAGLTPALQSARADVVSGLRGTRAPGRNTSGRARSVFVVAQLATSLILLFVGGMFARALQRAMLTDRGMNVDNVIVAEVNLSAHGYDRAGGPAFYGALMMRLASAPEVGSAALGQWTPLSFGHNSADMKAADGTRVSVTFGVADTGYLNTMHIPLVQGRAFSAADANTGAPVAIVNETFAKLMWPGQTALGNQIKLNGTRTIVGVVRDGKYRTLDEAR